MYHNSFTRKFFWLTSLIVAAGMLLAACSPTAYQTAVPTVPAAQVAPTTAPTMAPMTVAAEPTISVVTDAKLGKILVDGKGMTLYVFTKDSADKSNCTGGCIKNWPAVMTQGSPKAGDGVDTSMLGSAALPDGSKIVTYNHMPLYTFINDTKPGDTTGQGKGTVWFTVAPSGQMVKGETNVPATGGNSAGAATLNVATDAKLGKILVDGKGMTLYIFTRDTPDTSTCTGGCAKAWPPFTSAAAVTVGAGVDSAMIGSATLADGSKIVTYNHMPLYYFQGDKKPGDTNGQGVGSVWYVIGPDGKVIQGQAPAAPAAPAAPTATAGSKY